LKKVTGVVGHQPQPERKHPVLPLPPDAQEVELEPHEEEILERIVSGDLEPEVLAGPGVEPKPL
jgi:hypothetical protein